MGTARTDWAIRPPITVGLISRYDSSMLKFISVESFALIDRLEVEFKPGLNLISGETGSGKSILVDAVSLLIGTRASQEMIRQGNRTARIEGIFSPGKSHPVHELLRQAGLEGPEDELIVRREISEQGTNKVFVNGRLTTLAILGELGPSLADIHGQHDQQQLLKPSSHLEFLDAYAGNGQSSAKVKDLHRDWCEVRQALKALQENLQRRLQRQDLLRYQIEEIEALNLHSGLDQELEAERNLLNSSGQRMEQAQTLYDRLYEREESVLAQLGSLERHLERLAELDSTCGELFPKLKEARFALEDLALQMRDYSERIEFSPGRLEKVEQRLAQIQKAKRKYGDSVEQILTYWQQARCELDELGKSEDRSRELESRQAVLRRQYLESAAALTKRRRDAGRKLSASVQRELAELAMEESRFEVAFQTDSEKITQSGQDEVEFLISPNPGEEPRAVAKIASGGEISRVMLALKSILLVEDYSKTLVFDEIDAGIGGRVASGLGRRLAALARRQQTFCVTHLPQIAALADQHFCVRKELFDNRTVIRIELLTGKARVEELSRMLAGRQVTDTTRRQARELLRTSS